MHPRTSHFLSRPVHFLMCPFWGDLVADTWWNKNDSIIDQCRFFNRWQMAAYKSVSVLRNHDWYLGVSILRNPLDFDDSTLIGALMVASLSKEQSELKSRAHARGDFLSFKRQKSDVVINHCHGGFSHFIWSFSTILSAFKFGDDEISTGLNVKI